MPVQYESSGFLPDRRQYKVLVMAHRRKIPRYWSYWSFIHAFMYLALFFAIVHANLIGTDFQNGTIAWVYDGLFVAVVAAFLLKRLQQYRIRVKLKSKRAAHS